MRSIPLIAAGLVVTSAYALDTKQLPHEMRSSDPFSMPLIIEAGESDWSDYGTEAPPAPIPAPVAASKNGKADRTAQRQVPAPREAPSRPVTKDTARLGDPIPVAAAPAQAVEAPTPDAVPVPPPSPAKVVVAAPASEPIPVPAGVLADVQPKQAVASPVPASLPKTADVPAGPSPKKQDDAAATRSAQKDSPKLEADKLPKIDAAAIEKGLAGVIEATSEKPVEAPAKVEKKDKVEKVEKPEEKEKPKPHFTGNQGKAKPVVLASVSKPVGMPNGDLMRTVRYFDSWNLTCDLNLGKNERICSVEQSVAKDAETFVWKIATAQDKKAIVHFDFTAKADAVPGLKVVIAGFERSIAAEEWACGADRCTAYFPIAGIVQSWFSGNPSVKFRYSVDGKPVELDATMGGFETAMRAASEDPFGIKTARATTDTKSQGEKVASAEAAPEKR
ncbi:invasion associated locus B family protein [Microvirga tunisiensis]|uniref:Invasion associated locus B family protein n=1 Tax=Microvirga tunisiensis TaxID=2108360 RepID=A0A5N7MBQ2_9HYPH|nr:invasion associated locus B family protein [Microvirga tunisiensis]MPR08149.1 hypothetical protein [Microvirga tunisiensis]MPR24138.1 hypothetical protein [Microvirga tunisiensis]